MRTTIRDIQRIKDHGERIPMITAYDYTSAQIADRAGIPMVLVGDSLGQVVLGYSTTVPVTIEDMIHHCKAVVRGSEHALIVGDMPFLTYATQEQALKNAGRLLQEAGVQAVKLEGGENVAPAVAHLVEQGIPVMGHLGLTPQSVNQLGLRVQGKHASQARRLIEDAVALQDAGAFAIVLELVPAELAKEITARLRVPTIGIGAGVGCDGQVQVWHDLLGLFTEFVPRHTTQYANLAEIILSALQQFATDVRTGSFPTEAQSSSMDGTELQAALAQAESA